MLAQVRRSSMGKQEADVEEYLSRSEEETLAIARAFARRLRPGDTVALYGDLGAGKTEFIKGICQYFHVEELVTSPTFAIINQYFGSLPDRTEIPLYHVDLYRVRSRQELEEIGFAECVSAGDAIKLVEWSENADGLLPRSHWAVHIWVDPEQESVRHIRIERVQSQE